MSYKLLSKDFNPEAKISNREARRRREAKREKARAVRRANREIVRFAENGDLFTADSISSDPRGGWVD